MKAKKRHKRVYKSIDTSFDTLDKILAKMIEGVLDDTDRINNDDSVTKKTNAINAIKFKKGVFDELLKTFSDGAKDVSDNVEKYFIRVSGKKKKDKKKIYKKYSNLQLDSKSFLKKIKKALLAKIGTEFTRQIVNKTLTTVFDRFAMDTKAGIQNDLLKIDREQSKELASKYKLNYVRYQGGRIKYSRDFCIERNGKVFHIEEMKKFGTPLDAFNGYTDKENGVFNGKWKGAKLNVYYGGSGYDPLTDLGCYNCIHFLDYLPRSRAIKIRPELELLYDD